MLKTKYLHSVIFLGWINLTLFVVLIDKKIKIHFFYLWFGMVGAEWQYALPTDDSSRCRVRLVSSGRRCLWCVCQCVCMMYAFKPKPAVCAATLLTNKSDTRFIASFHAHTHAYTHPLIASSRDTYLVKRRRRSGSSGEANISVIKITYATWQNRNK